MWWGHTSLRGPRMCTSSSGCAFHLVWSSTTEGTPANLPPECSGLTCALSPALSWVPGTQRNASTVLALTRTDTDRAYKCATCNEGNHQSFGGLPGPG